ncbi:hypothetical protein P148_SR1C00001G0672 [candidate division SR1 bacterium RAAC1_SR1_1]|nr:hypothetical protein P148_SR1C00001G0672 [candidate division SR1 bacterium RAAC1_SR1_1]
MYLYGFTTFAGIDKVMKVDRDDLGFSAGDLLQSDDEYFLVLGNEVSFTEQYTSRFPEGRQLQLIYSGFFSKKHIDWIHWMVAEYYSTYRNVMKYFSVQDVESLLKREIQKKPVGLKSLHIDAKNFDVVSVAEKGQTLIVYPDLWTMTMMVDESVRNQAGVLFLHSSDSQVKKDKAFWQVKHGLVKYILVTHAELFQDFHDLQSVVLVHPYKRYYANQQDPRYKTPDVLAYLASIWKIKLMEE